MISIIIPTYNESKNVEPLLKGIDQAMIAAGISDYEAVVMDDDSPDGTVAVVEKMGQSKFRAVNRRGKIRGLSEAVIDGFSQAKGDILAVMDADLSHPTDALPRLARAISQGALVAVGSRYVPGGGVNNWPWKRRFVSRVSCLLARPVTPIKDATSGFFMFRREVIQGVRLSPLGFKIGLEVYVKGKHQGKIKEVPYVFTDRREGQSKLGSKVMGQYLRQLWDLLWRAR